MTILWKKLNPTHPPTLGLKIENNKFRKTEEHFTTDQVEGLGYLELGQLLFGGMLSEEAGHLTHHHRVRAQLLT